MIKRIIDVLTALTALLLLSPVLIIVAILVRLKLGAPILFKQQRTGFNGELFNMYKFRTMLNTTDDDGNLLDDHLRRTKFGDMLRKLSLDELPELFNILLGDMSLIGPRPLLPEYLPLYSKEQFRRHTVKPGISGWAQINGRNSISWKEKFELDVWYVDHASIWLDSKIIFLTVRKVLFSEDIDHSSDQTMPKFNGHN